MKKFDYVLLALLGMLTIGVNAQGDPGDLDVTFNGTGMVIQDNGFMDVYQDVKMMTDGRIVAVGTRYDAVYAADLQVTCFQENGSLDGGFGTDGVFQYHLGYETGAYACHPLDDGSLLVAGISMDNFGGFEMILLKLTGQGVPDLSFGVDGVARFDYGAGEDMAFGLMVQEDGGIILAGTVKNEEWRPLPALVRFTGNGILDTTFGDNGLAVIPVTEDDNEFVAAQVQEDGKIVAVGHISNGLSWFSLLVARFGADGVLDPSFGVDGVVNMNLNNVDDEFFDLRITSAGDIVATGFTTTQPDLDFHLLVAKFDPDGALIQDFGDNGLVVWGETSYNVGYAMEILPDDKIVVAGSSGEKAPGDADWGIWKLNADGSFDQSFGNGGGVTTDGGGQFDEALGITSQEDGRLVVAGKFRINDNIDFGVARYLNDLTVSVPEQISHPDLQLMPNPACKGGMVMVSTSLPENQTVTIEIRSMTGAVVYKRSFGMQAAGSMNARLRLPEEITAGIYILHLTGSRGISALSRVVVIE